MNLLQDLEKFTPEIFERAAIRDEMKMLEFTMLKYPDAVKEYLKTDREHFEQARSMTDDAAPAFVRDVADRIFALSPVGMFQQQVTPEAWVLIMRDVLALLGGEEKPEFFFDRGMPK